MSKITINMLDINVAHASSFSEANLRCGGGAPRFPEKVEYVWGMQDWDGISIFTDKRLSLVDSVNSKLKVAWLMEPRAYDRIAYDKVVELENKFDLILTHDVSLLSRETGNYKYLPADTNIIEDASIGIHEKSKMTSFIYSNKTQLPGHQVRFVVAKFLNSKNHDIESYGRGCRPIERKADALKDYRFSIAIENSSAENYFTDKILDCFVTGTVPIYWGCPNVAQYFNPKGIIFFHTLEDLDNTLNRLTPQMYENMLPAIKENFEKAKYYMRLDDIVIDTIREEFNLEELGIVKDAT